MNPVIVDTNVILDILTVPNRKSEREDPMEIQHNMPHMLRSCTKNSEEGLFYSEHIAYKFILFE